MNGTIYDEIKKNGDSKKREKLKFFFAIISTNLLVAILCLSFGGHSPSLQSEKPAARILHAHYKMVVVPLTMVIDPDPNEMETIVSLMSKSKKILIEKAYLHEEVKNADRPADTSPRFKIEIPEGEVLKLSADPEFEMIAIPEVKLPPKEKTSTNKRVSHYEVNL